MSLAEPERRDHLVADHVAVVLAGDRLDHHRLHQMRRARPWYCSFDPGRPVEREVAHLGAHPRMVGPGRLGHVAGREAALVRHHLLQRDVAFAARGEFRQVVGDLVHEGQLALLDQRPYRGTGQHLGLAEQQEQGLVGRRHLGAARSSRCHRCGTAPVARAAPARSARRDSGLPRYAAGSAGRDAPAAWRRSRAWRDRLDGSG